MRRAPEPPGVGAVGLVSGAVALLLRLLGSTWRVRRLGGTRLARLDAADMPVVFAAWHGRSLPLLPTHLSQRCVIAVSRSPDGDRAARLLGHLGYSVVRGSSSRGGVAVLRGLLRKMHAGYRPSVTVDGPRGPSGTVAPGVVGLAALSGATIVPVAASCEWGLMLRSWDRAMVPAAFSSVVVAYGRPMVVGRSADRSLAARELELRLHDLHLRVDRLCGRVPRMDHTGPAS